MPFEQGIYLEDKTSPKCRMTQDEQMDQLERRLRLFLKAPMRENRARRESRKSRLTADTLGAYVKALRERDDAKEALAAKPGDSEAQEILRKAQEALDRSRNELKR